jgi:hypothetical protein
MAVVRRLLPVLTCAAALVAVACGDASFSPTSPSSLAGPGMSASNGAVITGTVSDMATTASLSASPSSGFSTLAATKPVTVTVVGTNVSTTIDGSGHFQLTGVPTGDVQLRFTGAGLDATLMLRGVQTGDRIDIKVRLTDTSVRIDAERRDRADDHDDDDEDEGDDDDEFTGLVSGLTGACPNISFTLNGTAVRANSATRYEDGSCAVVHNSTRVEVEGQRQTDGSILATRIELED